MGKPGRAGKDSPRRGKIAELSEKTGWRPVPGISAIAWPRQTKAGENQTWVIYFSSDPFSTLRTTVLNGTGNWMLKAWATLHSDTSRPFDKPASVRIAVKVINHLGDEVMKVFRV